MSNHPETLAKFCTADAALKILTNQSLRWSAPILFNDPFELNHQTSLSFDPHIMLEAVLRTTIGMIFSPDEPRGNTPLATVTRRWRGEERFASPEEAEEVLRELMGRMVDQKQDDIDELMTDWRRYTRQLRICCFSAKTNNLAAWRGYADNHRGVAIRFEMAAICGENTPQPILYKNVRPEITTLKEQVNAVLYNENPSPQTAFQERFLNKSPVMSNEQEWRCFYEAKHEASTKENDHNLWFDDRQFEANAVTALYFGANIDNVHKKALLEIVTEHYPHCKLFQATPLPGKYEIELQRFTK